MTLLDRTALDLMSAATIGRAVREGRLSALAVIESRLTRIEKLNPRLNCFTEILAERARREAEAIGIMKTPAVAAAYLIVAIFLFICSKRTVAVTDTEEAPIGHGTLQAAE